MSEPVKFTTTYRDHPIEVSSHKHDGICSINLGGAILYGDPRVRRGNNPTFEVWDDDKLVLSEYIESDIVGLLSEQLDELK